MYIVHIYLNTRSTETKWNVTFSLKSKDETGEHDDGDTDDDEDETQVFIGLV